MASSGDSWTKEYNEAAKLAEDIDGMVTEKAASASSGSESQRYFSAVRRKITILGTRLDGLEALLSKLPRKQPVTDKEMNRRKEMISDLRAKSKEMASALSKLNLANRDSLLGTEAKPVDAVAQTAGLDNHGVVTFQRQVIKEQDDGLEKLARTVTSTKHIALAVNEELELHTRLIESMEYQVETTGSRLQQMVKRVAIFNKRTSGCSCFSLMLSVMGIVFLILIIWMLIKYL